MGGNLMSEVLLVLFGTLQGVWRGAVLPICLRSTKEGRASKSCTLGSNASGDWH